LKYLSVCSGIEAATVAWEPLGWTPVGFSEIDAFPSSVLAHHYPRTPNFGDMTNHAKWPLDPGTVDLLVGGTPCQSFSVAGLRKGLADPRGNLMLTYLAIADRLRPRWVVWENVPGVLSSSGGRDFGAFVGALGELGYGWAYRVLDAQWCRTHGHPRAVPQRRRRVFVVGCLGDSRSAAEVLFERESVQRYSAKGRSAGQGSTTRAEGGVDVGNPKPIVIDRAAFNQGQNAQYDTEIGEADAMPALVAKGPHAVAAPAQMPPVIWREGDQANAAHCENFAGTLNCNKGQHGGIAALSPFAVRRLTLRECERLQGFPDDYTAVPHRGKPAADGPRYKALGNSMAVNCMEWIGERINAVNERITED